MHLGYMKKLLFVFAFIFGLFGLFGPAMAQNDEPHINMLDGARLVTQNGTLQTRNLLGRKSLVMFWKYDCPPCRVEMLEYSRTKRALGNMPVLIIVPKFTKLERNALAPAINNGAIIAQVDSNYSNLLGDFGDAEGGVPYSVMFGPNGRACIANLGPTNASVVKDMIKSC